MSQQSLRGHERRAEGVDPYLAFLIFAGLGLGTWAIDTELRLTILWLAMGAAVLIYSEREDLSFDYSLRNLGNGALLGLIISLPLLIFVKDYLRVIAIRLYVTQDMLALFHRLVLIASPIEETFFRGFVQTKRGLLPSVLLYSLTGLVYWLPDTPLLGLLVIMGVMATLGGIYSYVRLKHGLTASIGCSMVVYFVLMVCPGLIDSIMEMLV